MVVSARTLGKVGLMTVDRWVSEGHLGRRRVLLNGTDVTDRCTRFHDIDGWAELASDPLETNDDGDLDVEVVPGVITLRECAADVTVKVV